MVMWRLLSLVRMAAAACAIALVCSVWIGHAHAASDDDEARLTPPGAVSFDTDNYRLGSGDKLRVIVYGEDDLGGAFDVDGTGFISMPLIGQIKVDGLSAHEVERALVDKLSDGYLKEPRVNVQVVQYRPFYVLGEVNRPGQYPYVNEMSVLNAVALAGGYTEKAIESGVYIRRNGETREAYVTADPSTKIHPGDVVRVATSPFWEFLSVAGPLAGFASLRGTTF